MGDLVEKLCLSMNIQQKNSAQGCIDEAIVVLVVSKITSLQAVCWMPSKQQ